MAFDKSKYEPYFDKSPIDKWYENCFEGILIDDVAELERLTDVKGVTVAIDTETNGLTWGVNIIVGYSFSFSSKDGYYVPLRHLYNNIPLEDGIRCLKKLLYNNKCLFFNTIFDLMMIEQEGVNLNGIDSFEVQILVALADANIKTRNLKWATEHYLGRIPPTFNETLGSSDKNYFHFGYLLPSECVDYACHSKDTDVFTENGWICWENYNGTDALATVNLTNNLMEYQLPNKFIKYNYQGEMFTYKSDNQNYKVTPNHRMIIHRGQSLKNNLEFRQIQDFKVSECLYKKELIKLSTTNDFFVFGSLTISSTDLARLLGIVFSDGWVVNRTKTSRNYSIGIIVCKDTWREPIVDLLNRIGVNYGTYKEGTNYVFANKELWTYLKPYVGKGARTKHIPEIIKQMDSEDIKEFLLFYRYGDDYLSINKSKTEQYYTTSPSMANDLHELFAILGLKAKMRKRKPNDATFKDGRVIKKENCVDLYVFSVTKNSKVITFHKNNVTKELYDDYVYCAEVPNSTLITRRNGCILVSGNCNDSANTFGLYEKLYPVIEKECGKFVINLDNQLVKSFYLYYVKQPVYIDQQRMIELSDYMRTQILSLEKEIFKKLGTQVDLNCVDYECLIKTQEFGNINMQTLKEKLIDKNQNIHVSTPIGFKQVTNFIDTGIKQVVELTLLNDTMIKCSPDHYFLIKSDIDNKLVFKKVMDIDIENDDLIDYDLTFENLSKSLFELNIQRFENLLLEERASISI